MIGRKGRVSDLDELVVDEALLPQLLFCGLPRLSLLLLLSDRRVLLGSKVDSLIPQRGDITLSHNLSHLTRVRERREERESEGGEMEGNLARANSTLLSRNRRFKIEK